MTRNQHRPLLLRRATNNFGNTAQDNSKFCDIENPSRRCPNGVPSHSRGLPRPRLLNRTTTVYDLAGRSLASINPLQYRTTQVYDLAGRSIATVDALNYRTTTLYDAASRSLATINALKQRVTMAYDAASQRIGVTDGNGHRITFLFDPVGRDAGSIDPLGRRVTLGYDPAGRKLFKLDPRLNRATFGYDAASQRIKDIFADGLRTSYAYDPVGNRTKMSDWVGITSTIYDILNRVVTQNNPVGGRVSYTFDPAGRRGQMIDPQGGRFTYGYDPASQLIKLNNPQGNRTSFIFNPVGWQTGQIFGNGSRTTQVFNAASWLTGQIQVDGIGLTRRTTSLYDLTGRRTSTNESSGIRTSWTFDPTGQLVHEQGTTSSPFNITYTYDNAGNRLVENQSGTRTSSTYDAANELLVQATGTARVTYQFDNNGNQTQKNSGSAITYYDWDVRNQLAWAEPVGGVVTYTYDGSAKRVERQVSGATVQYLYDFEKVLRETDGNNNLLNEYTSTDDQYGNLVSAYGNGTTSYFEFNPQFSTEALLSNSGSVTDRMRYLAFGLGTQTQGTDTFEKTFVGKQGYIWDSMVDLYFMGPMERPYDPVAGRFTKEDSIGGYRSGWNLYEYCFNDPVNKIDPSGLIDTSNPSPAPPPNPAQATPPGNSSEFQPMPKQADPLDPKLEAKIKRFYQDFPKWFRQSENAYQNQARSYAKAWRKVWSDELDNAINPIPGAERLWPYYGTKNKNPSDFDFENVCWDVAKNANPKIPILKFKYDAAGSPKKFQISKTGELIPLTAQAKAELEAIKLYEKRIAEIATWTQLQKLEYAFELVGKRAGGDVQKALKEFATPRNLLVFGGTLLVGGALSGTVLALVVLTIGYALLGEAIFDVASEAIDFFVFALEAKSDSDFEDAVTHGGSFIQKITGVGIALVAGTGISRLASLAPKVRTPSGGGKGPNKGSGPPKPDKQPTPGSPNEDPLYWRRIQANDNYPKKYRDEAGKIADELEARTPKIEPPAPKNPLEGKTLKEMSEMQKRGETTTAQIQEEMARRRAALTPKVEPPKVEPPAAISEKPKLTPGTEEPVPMPPVAARRLATGKGAFDRAVKELNVDRARASKALHQAKKKAGRGGNDNVAIDLENGDIIAPETGEVIGNLFD